MTAVSIRLPDDVAERLNNLADHIPFADAAGKGLGVRAELAGPR